MNQNHGRPNICRDFLHPSAPELAQKLSVPLRSICARFENKKYVWAILVIFVI